MISEGTMFKSKFHNISLMLLELEEPNNGRMRWSFELIIDGNTTSNKLINGYSGLVENLQEYRFESGQGDFIFLPLEHENIVFDVKHNDFVSLSGKAVNKNNHFVSNSFTTDRLILSYQMEIIVIDLVSWHGINITFPIGKIQIKKSEFVDKDLFVTYKDLSDYQTYCKRYDLNLMVFKDE